MQCVSAGTVLTEIIREGDGPDAYYVPHELALGLTRIRVCHAQLALVLGLMRRRAPNPKRIGASVEDDFVFFGRSSEGYWDSVHVAPVLGWSVRYGASVSFHEG